MLLSDRDIKEELKNEWLVVTPTSLEFIQPASLEVRLDKTFQVFYTDPRRKIDPSMQQDYLTYPVTVSKGGPFVLNPGMFVLASTYERVKLPDDIAARLEGKSSLGRIGLLTHATAGFIDPGFEGHITLELTNLCRQPIYLWPGMKIGQLCFFRLSSPSDRPYGSIGVGSHYQGQTGPTPAIFGKDFHISNVYGDDAND
jgi:dCTP deaminase